MNELETLINDRKLPWTEVDIKTKTYWIVLDAYPVTDGHRLFIPTEQNIKNLMDCYKAAYQFGYNLIMDGRCEGFNVGQNVGQAAGQTVLYPHVHLIPRRNGDMEDPRGGVRHVIPEKGNYKR